jgi:hypothetical protein
MPASVELMQKKDDGGGEKPEALREEHRPRPRRRDAEDNSRKKPPGLRANSSVPTQISAMTTGCPSANLNRCA